MSWPLKYRPRSFDELALRDVREQLKKLLNSGAVPQVFLFAGPKGSGKTSTSRIISTYLNNDLDDKEKEKIFNGNSFIVNEMDAASNRGIDDIRLLKERVVMPPQLGKKTVYILDEAHMLTKEAFNALLKLLEEPPEHAVFILATTELHKVPDTIISRANLVKFRQATTDELTEVLSRILEKEQVKFEPDALNGVIGRADGSFRDAVKLLEMVCRGEKKLTSASLEVLGSLTLKEDLRELINSVISKDEQKLIKIIQGFRDRGEDEKYLFKTLLEFLHEDLLRSLGVNTGTAVFTTRVSLFFLDSLTAISPQPSPIPFLGLEIKLLDLIFKAKEKLGSNSPQAKPAIKTGISASTSTAAPIVKKNSPEVKNETTLEVLTDVVQINNLSPSPIRDFVSDNLVEPSGDDFVSLQGVWEEFVKALEAQNLTLAAIVKSGKLLPSDTGTTKVGVYYQFHKAQLEQQKQMSVLMSCGQAVSGGIPRFEFILLPPHIAPVAKNVDQVANNQKKSDQVAENLESAISEALL